MNADPTTLQKSRKVFRAALLSVFAHNLPDPEPFRRACRDLDDTFQIILDFIPNQACFPVHAFRLLCRLRRTVRRWTALIPRIVKPPNLLGLKSLPTIIHCPNPWPRRRQSPTPSTESTTSTQSTMSRRNEMKADLFTMSRRNEMKADLFTMSRRNEMKADQCTPSTTLNRCPHGSKGSHTDAPNPNHASLANSTDAPLQTAAQSAAHSPLTTSGLPRRSEAKAGSPLSISQALHHERQQAWKLALPLPHIHPPRPRSAQRVLHALSQSRRRLAEGGRPRTWTGWKELPGPDPQSIPASFTPAPLPPDANAPTQFTMSRRNEMKADQFTPSDACTPSTTLNRCPRGSKGIPTDAPNSNHAPPANPAGIPPQTPAQRAAMLPADNFRLPAQSHHASRIAHHAAQHAANSPLTTSGSLLSSPLSYQRALDKVILQIVTSLTRALVKTNRLYQRDPDPKARNHPDHELIQPAASVLQTLLRERLEAIWFHAHNPTDQPQGETQPHSTMSRRQVMPESGNEGGNEMEADMSRRKPQAEADMSRRKPQAEADSSTESTSTPHTPPPSNPTPPP